MSLKKENVYLDDWKDLKEYTAELEKEEAEKKDQHNVTKDFVDGQIEDYKEYDEAKEQAEYDKIYQKIADISAGGGTDLSPYLKKEEAAATYATKSEIPDTTNFATKDEIPDVTDFATKEEVAAVDAKVDAIDLTSYATTEYVNNEIARVEDEIPDVSAFVTEQQMTQAIAAAQPDLSGLATKEEVAAVDQKVDAIDLSPYATKTEVAAEDTSVLNNVLGRIWSSKDADATKGCFNTKLTNSDGNLAQIFNESDGGGVIFEDKTRKLKTFVGVNDGGDPVTGIHAQIYSKDTTTNEGARLNINPSGMYYGVGASTPIDANHELAVKGDIPSIEGLAHQDDVDAALAEKADIIDVSTAFENMDYELNSKANADEVVFKADYDELKAKFEYLEQLVMEYLPDAEQEKINDGKIDDLGPDNKAVNIVEPMQSVKLPEATVAYTVDVPLKENATVELTSNKYAYINNTSEEPVSVAFGREVPSTEAETVANPFVYITGQYDTITISNVKIQQKDPDVNSINNVVITEDNEKTVEITAALADGCTITNNSACPVTINNKAVTPQDGEPNSIIIVAPNSTVTLSGGQYNELTSTVGTDTLFINKAAHIKKLIVTKGNVVVNDYSVEDHIDEIVNDTEYTVTPKTIEVYTQSDWTKASTTPALYEVQNDITTTSRIAPGLFGSSARIKLNGHKVTCSDAQGAFLLRGTSHYIIENGTIDCTQGYGVWLSGAGTVELKDVVIDADAHALYIEKDKGQIITSGNCRFSVKNDDKRYVANYYDATYTSGWTTGFHFGAGTQFVDFDPAASMGEPGGLVNLLDPGFHTVKTTETIDGVEHDIYIVVADE